MPNYKEVSVTISETSGRYIFDESGEMHMEDNPNAGKEPIEFSFFLDENTIDEHHEYLSEMFPTCHVNFVWDSINMEKYGPNFIAGASKWAMAVESAF